MGTIEMFHVFYHVNHIWYFMVGEPPTSSIQWIRTWKWRIRTPPSGWWSERIFAPLSVCIVFPLFKKRKKEKRKKKKFQTISQHLQTLTPMFHKTCWFLASDRSCKGPCVKQTRRRWCVGHLGLWKAGRWRDIYIQQSALGHTRETHRHHEGRERKCG